MIQLSKARLSVLLKIHRMNSTRRGDMSARSASRQPMRRVLPVWAIESSGPLTAGHRPLALLDVDAPGHRRAALRLVGDRALGRVVAPQPGGEPVKAGEEDPLVHVRLVEPLAHLGLDRGRYAPALPHVRVSLEP